MPLHFVGLGKTLGREAVYRYLMHDLRGSRVKEPPGRRHICGRIALRRGEMAAS
jgi:hypothetical protein